MSGSEIMVSLVFLLLGYWIVSYFMDRGAKPPRPWHEVLNVNANASVDEIRAAYQRLEKSTEITAAYREAMLARNAEP